MYDLHIHDKRIGIFSSTAHPGSEEDVKLLSYSAVYLDGACLGFSASSLSADFQIHSPKKSVQGEK